MSIIKSNGAGSGASGGFFKGVATQSLRLDGGSQITLDNADAATSNKIATLSTWFKRADELSTLAYLFHSKNDGSFGDGSNGLASFSITLDAADTISVVQYNGNTSFNANQYDFGVVISGRKFRDMTSWYHLVVAIDTTQGAEADRIKMYINGARQTVVAIADGSGYQDFADEDQLIAVNQDGEQRWGGTVDDGNYAHVYLAETIGVDGLALAASNFGETKNGIWIAKSPSVSEYGNHGYRLQYKFSAVGTGADDTIGCDTSGKNNHFTSTNVVASDCNIPDSPENVFATLMGGLAEGANEYQSYAPGTYSNGTLNITGTAAGWCNGKSNFLVNSGKWYVECRVNAWNGSNYVRLGVYARPARTYDEYFILGNGSGQIDAAARNVVSSFGTGVIIQIALDLENNNIFFGIDNTWSNSATASEIVAGTATNAFASGSNVPTGDGFDYGFYFNPHSTGTNITVNFGQDSAFGGEETATTNTDSEGFGTFQYAPPTGFLAMCTSNIVEPAVGNNSDILPNQAFNTVLYTSDDIGASGTQNVTGVGFKPDWVWIKNRDSNSTEHTLYDSSRGTGRHLSSSSAAVEVGLNSQYGYLGTFGNDGFTLRGGSTNSNYVAQSTDKYVSWNWKLNGGTTSTNSDGSADSTVQVNRTLGMSQVLYTGNASGAGAEQTIGHGLGVIPDVILFKARDYGGTWYMYHKDLDTPNDNHLYLAGTNAEVTTSNDYMNRVGPTDEVFSLGYEFATNKASATYIAYCFKSITGYSKYGVYEGNSNASGTYVHLGFRPKWVMIKNIDGAGDNWYVADDVRETADAPGNPITEILNPNTTNDEYTTGSNKIDFLANGFKCRDASSGDTNINNEEFIYWAFAEAPFKYANSF
tara:strand:+ start:1917 stop:4532 length:2616 start_codon:yes stop_codon:yes gene_type:complete